MSEDLDTPSRDARKIRTDNLVTTQSSRSQSEVHSTYIKLTWQNFFSIIVMVVVFSAMWVTNKADLRSALDEAKRVEAASLARDDELNKQLMSDKASAAALAAADKAALVATQAATDKRVDMLEAQLRIEHDQGIMVLTILKGKQP